MRKLYKLKTNFPASFHKMRYICISLLMSTLNIAYRNGSYLTIEKQVIYTFSEFVDNIIT